VPRPDNDISGVAPEAEALERALKFIDYRPRSSGETRLRLRRYGYDASTIAAVIDHLQAAGILDDADFGRLYMAELVGKGLGFYRVRSELQRKMLARELVDGLLEEYPSDDELERATAVAERRVGRAGGEGDERSGRRKLCEYLVRRGYSRQVAEAAVRAAWRVDTPSEAELQ